jgi:hypothetical protein
VSILLVYLIVECFVFIVPDSLVLFDAFSLLVEYPFLNCFYCVKNLPFHYLLMPGPPNRLTPGKLCAPLAVPSGFFGCTIFGNLGDFVPDLPGVPVYDFLNLSGPAATWGLFNEAMLPALVAPAVACSLFTLRISISFIFIMHI